MKGIIPIGGRGTRMRPITYSQNKHFIPVGNKRLIEYPIESMVGAGITDIAITYNPGQLPFAEDVLGDGSGWGARFTYILQPEPLGLANIYQVCEEWTKGDSFVLHLGDNIFTEGIRKAIVYFEKEQPNGLVMMVHHPENVRLGVPYFDEHGRLIKYVEKPTHPPHDFAIPGLYLMDSNGFNPFKGEDAMQPSGRGEYEIPDAYQWLIDHGYRVDVIEYEGKWLDPGKFNDWLETNQYLLDTQTTATISGVLDSTVSVQGRVTVGKNCIITNTVIRGPVNIGNNVIIENSFIGPYTSIYHGCTVKGCRIDNSVLMEQVVIEDVKKHIDSSVIGPFSHITSHKSSHEPIEMFLGEMTELSL